MREDQFLVHYPIRVFLCIVTGTFYWIIKIEAFLSGNTFNGSLLPPSYTSHIHTHSHTHTHTHTRAHTQSHTETQIETLYINTKKGENNLNLITDMYVNQRNLNN